MTKNHLASMTGFGRDEASFNGATTQARWAWEIRSLNGRGIDVRCRMPSQFEALESELRKRLTAHFSRGSFTCNLHYRAEASAGSFVINEAALGQAIAAIEAVRIRTECELPSADGLLALKGVLTAEDPEVGDEERDQLHAALLASLDKAITAIKSARLKEGEGLAKILTGQIDAIQSLITQAKQLEKEAISQIRDRLAVQIADLLPADTVPTDRIAQEAALLAVKADIREELDRLVSHIENARDLISSGANMGRKLDFLSQEFNREANTLCSKTPSMELKRIGLELKSVIDQFREQIQNVE